MTHHLFTARSRHLLGEIAAADVAGYLSGLLVGSEVLSGVEAARFAPPSVVIADPDVAARYRVAFSMLAPDRVVEFVADTAPIGLWRIATVSGWWPGTEAGSKP